MWLCPGQGAQKVGMGKDLAERFPAARETFQAIDDALGTALSTLMFAGPEDELTLTHNAQPAILAHSAAVFAVVRDKVATPAAAAGHSLGEYSAYVTAGALPAADAAKLVRRRGELMHKAGTERPGTMAVLPCFSSIWMDSKVSTTPTATRSATDCWWRSPVGCGHRSRRRIRSRVSVAMSSCS